MSRLFFRRRFIVDWQLQGSLCWHGLLYGCLVLVTVTAGIFLPLLWNLGDALDRPGFEEQAIVMLYMHDRFWLLAVVCCLIVTLGAMRFSHRIAGPLVRFKRNLRLLAEGKLPPPLRTRRSDYLKQEVACLNAAVAGVESRVQAVQQAQAAVQRELNRVLEQLSPQQARQLAALTAAAAELEQATGAFAHCDPGDEHAPDAEVTPQLVAAAGAEA